MVVFLVLYDKLVILPQELYQNRRLIWKLAKNDFNTRYAGSYMGMVWAMVQPVVTVVLYYFVFEVIFQNKATLLASGIEAPYVLWLTAGLVPWFYFSEAIVQGTQALLEYNYLVKKVVFKISILPIIKIIGATFIHVFFALILILLYFAYGYTPDLYLLQIPYFSFCMFIFVLALSYATCAIVVFFRDLTQIINILLQVGMWATPILWDITMLKGQWEPFRIIFKMNPVYYVVNGYRSALFEKTWFWQDFYSTMYFWIVTAVLFGICALIFKRLKIHFADVM
ncbi:MAG: ABC transporter permease [Lachnospiraceae bacterium]|nr:ABC transporter permease [Lachnospiraceae bacterium]